MVSRIRMTGLLLLGVFTATACNDAPPNILSPQSPVLSHTETACDASLASQIEAQIATTFTKANVRNDAQKQFGKIKTACPTNNAQAVALTVALIDFARKHYPTNAPDAEKVTTLWNQLQVYVTHGDHKTIHHSWTVEGGAQVCGSSGCVIPGALQTAGLIVPPGAVSSSHLFAFWKTACFDDDDSHVDPVGPCFQFEVWPTTTFSPDVTVAICTTLDTPEDVRTRGLIGQFHAQQFQVTPRGQQLNLDCDAATDFVTSEPATFGRRFFARLADLLSPELLYATHPTSTGSVKTFSTLGVIDPLIFWGNFNRFALGNLPSGSEDSVGTWNTFTVAPGSVQIVSSLGDLTDKPVKLDAAGGNASGGEGVRLEGIVKNPTPAPPGVYAVTWRSLAASPNVDSAFISLRSLDGTVIARVKYQRGQAAKSGTLHYVSTAGEHLIGNWSMDVNQKFDLELNFHTGQVKVVVDGVNAGTFGFTTASPANLYSINFELLGRDVHTLGADDVRIDRLPDYEAVPAP